jgi:hypothetical protein
LSTSIFNLFELIKAISEPEKKAEKTRLIKMIRPILMKLFSINRCAKVCEDDEFFY